MCIPDGRIEQHADRQEQIEDLTDAYHAELTGEPSLAAAHEYAERLRDLWMREFQEFRAPEDLETAQEWGALANRCQGHLQ